MRGSDGTLTILTGSDFAGSTGAAGTLAAGTITAVSRTNAARTVTFETLTGFTYAATAFSTRLTTEADLQGIAADILVGNDTLNGYSGDDFFKGFAGNDTINGGGGVDTVRYSGPFHSGSIAISLGAISTIAGNGTAGIDTLTSIEAFVGSNSNAGDTYVVDGNFSGSFGTFNMFEGRGGNDAVTGNGNTWLSFAESIGGAHNPGEQILLATVFNTAAAGVRGLTLIA